MKTFHLRFTLAERRSADGQIDLVSPNRDETTQAPDGGGAYVLGAVTTTLIYPWGDSPVFYIGKAARLRRRLRTHRANARKAASEHDKHWHPRHRYAEAFGAIPAANTTWPGRQRRREDDEAES